MKKLKKYIIPILCIFNVLLHLISIQYLEFHRDELLYFSLSNHLDLGYASVPPFISWMAYLMKGIFGFSMFSVKLLPALLSGAFVYLGAKVAKELGGSHYAQVLTIIALMCTPFGLRAFILFQPVPFDVFFWTLIYYIILKYINTEQNKWLYILGIVIGITILNKYLVLLQLFSLILIIPFTKYRNLFLKPQFYTSLGIAFVIISPNFYWQLTNDTPLFTHFSSLQETQLQYVEKSTFIIEQGLMFYASFLIAVLGGIFLFRYQRKKQLWLFSLSALFVISALLFMNGKAYYTAGVYPFLIAAGSVFISTKMKTTLSKALVIGPIIVMILPLIPMGIPILPPKKLAHYFDRLEDVGVDIGRIHEDGNKHRLPQDYADMLGWHEIAAIAKEAYDSIDDKQACAIFGENYGIAGAVSLLNAKYGMPEVMSFSDTYEYWVPREFSKEITSFIYINDELGRDVQLLFDDIKAIGTVDDPLSRQYGTTIYLCQKPRRSFNKFWLARVISVTGE